MEKIKRTSKGRHPKGNQWEQIAMIEGDQHAWKVYKKLEDSIWQTYKIAVVGKLKGQANFRVKVNSDTKYVVKSKDHFALKEQWPEVLDKFQSVLVEGMAT